MNLLPDNVDISANAVDGGREGSISGTHGACLPASLSSFNLHSSQAGKCSSSATFARLAELQADHPVSPIMSSFLLAIFPSSTYFDSFAATCVHGLSIKQRKEVFGKLGTSL